jgi:hypothetical protein
MDTPQEYPRAFEHLGEYDEERRTGAPIMGGDNDEGRPAAEVRPHVRYRRRTDQAGGVGAFPAGRQRGPAVLIIEIALGIVLGVILLRVLPALIGCGCLLTVLGLLIWGGIALVSWVRSW